ncbi:BamA/TamA family outer membrane protein [Parasedimentitalea psychrophila]|uniref:BamA/TamA family outer membrane protein n=1 Tax=Parasedimentitalea psychrophila TaxID=2997337 RepID=A0A9Y2KZ26_9RHOB|nr:BamA/TamA family outer membrane protein [Parasedimentitalea psychrophila]WIY24940.1 BamA/TamA family outer membrane protein [Parasedimentitalea psychrophila]
MTDQISRPFLSDAFGYKRLTLSQSCLSRAVALVLLCCTAPQAVQAVGPDDVHRQMDHVQTAGAESNFGFSNGSVIVAPVPFSNPTIGSGLALGAGYLFKTDPGSNTSVIGLGAMRSDNGSQAVGLMTNLAFNNNRWLVSIFAGKADVRYDLYTPLGPFPVHQDGDLARFNLAYGVTEELSFGGVMRYLNTSISGDRPGLPSLPPSYEPDLNLEIITAGFSADWDRRDNSDYPTDGSRLTAEATRSFLIDSVRASYDKADVTYDAYHPLGADKSLAFRGVLCAATDETPFFDQCSIGATDNMRGFNSTQFLDLRSTSLQAEYRHRFGPRWGAVVFGGIGWTGADLSSLGDNGSHSAVGLGARYRVSKKFPVDFSVDLSHSNLGDDQIYIYVGQRF